MRRWSGVRPSTRATSGSRSSRARGRCSWRRGSTGPAWARSPGRPGVSKGTLYVYFENKEDLFEALAIQEKASLAEALFTLDADDPDVPGVLTRLGSSFLTEMCRPAHVSLVRMVIGASEKFPRFGQVYYQAGPARGVERLSRYLDAQVQAGRLTIADTELAARHFLHLCQAGLLTRLLFAAGGIAGEAEMRHQVDEAVRVFLAGYGPAR
ncbi:TetR family transcriptional regulator [Methylobacterium radiotolerans]|nr:TetR family transcriptional regulator [Methylobacterium radiotolerans]